MHLVLISYHFPPSPEVGGLRAAKVAQAFRQAGHAVSVITARLPQETGPVRQREPGFEVLTVRPGLGPRELVLRLTRRFRPPRTQAAGQGPAAPAPVAAVPIWKRAIYAWLWLPDDRQGFIRPAARLARHLVRAGADVLYTTAPPFSTHLAGLVTQWRTGVRWAVEFRDPWTGNPVRPHARTRLTDAITRWLERRCLRRASWVVSVSPGIHEPLVAGCPADQRHKLLVVQNGIDHLAPRVPARQPGGPLRFLHLGSLYLGRDPRPFLQALGAAVRRRGLPPDAVEVLFLGQGRWYHDCSVEQAAAEAGLSGSVRFEDWVPHEESLRYLEQADVLLLLAQRQPAQIPNKLYEYLATRKPILAFADAGGETAGLLARVGGHQVVTGADPAEAQRAVEQLLDGPAGSPQPDEAVLESLTTASQFRPLLEAITG